MHVNDVGYLLYTYAFDCKNEVTTSVANLVGTSIKFSSTLAYAAMGHAQTGGSVLSSNDQILSVSIRGRCGSAYFTSFTSDHHLMFGDTHPVLGERLIPVDFASTFTTWTEWTACSVTCGDGIRTRSRTCQSFCSSVTVADTNESEACNLEYCSLSF